MKYKIKHILLVLLVVANSGFLLAQNKELSDSIKIKSAERRGSYEEVRAKSDYSGNCDIFCRCGILRRLL